MLVEQEAEKRLEQTKIESQQAVDELGSTKKV
jgi:hypothetical protein